MCQGHQHKKLIIHSPLHLRIKKKKFKSWILLHTAPLTILNTLSLPKYFLFFIQEASPATVMKTIYYIFIHLGASGLASYSKSLLTADFKITRSAVWVGHSDMFQYKLPFPAFPSTPANHCFYHGCPSWLENTFLKSAFSHPASSPVLLSANPSFSQIKPFPPLSKDMLSFLQPSVWHLNYFFFPVL